MDDKKKKKQDAKRISLTQKHEVDYLKKSAKGLIKLIDEDHKVCKKVLQEDGHVDFMVRDDMKRIKTTRIKRICKALILCLEKKK